MGMLPLDSKALRILWTPRADWELRLAESADLAAVSGFASMMPGAVSRIALAFPPPAQSAG
jgi:hypothetical protein